ncbi:hypothetical protein Tco_0213797 [Tanacetum coccineum]
MTPTPSAALLRRRSAPLSTMYPIPLPEPSPSSSEISSSSSSGSLHLSSSSESSSISNSHVSSSEISSPFSSSNTAHTSSGPLPHRRKQCSDYATPSSSTSAGPSRKRSRSSNTSMLISAHPLSSLSPVRADLLSHRKRFRGSSAASPLEDSMEADSEGDSEIEAEVGTEADIEVDIKPAIEANAKANTKADAEDSVGDIIEIAVDVIVEPDTPPAPLVPTFIEWLDEHKEVIQGMYDHLLEMLKQRLEEIKDEQRTLGEEAKTAELERTALRDRVRSSEISNLSLHDTLRAEIEAYARIERLLGNVSKELRQSRISHHDDRESFRRLDTFMIKHHGYHP